VDDGDKLGIFSGIVGFLPLGDFGKLPKEIDEIKAAKGLKNVGKCLKKNSFAPDTKVLTADGKSKPIKDLKVGDDVKTGDPTTGKSSGSHKITATMINHDSNLLNVVITTADGRRNVLHTTTEHPFWDDTAHAWVDAAALTPGHMLVTATNQTVAISGLFRLPSPAKDMYNLTVQDLHTYYVLAGGTPVLVHNSGGRGPCIVGQQGEAAAGITKNTEALRINGRDRIPDELDHAAGVIGEVKNVKYQHLSTQIKDDLQYAAANGYQMRLYVRGSTRLSGPLQAKVDSGEINLIRNLP
jgi:hypothetical protein